MSGELEKLRDELIEFEKIIAEFQKWKLIGIGAVFATGLVSKIFALPEESPDAPKASGADAKTPPRSE